MQHRHILHAAVSFQYRASQRMTISCHFRQFVTSAYVLVISPNKSSLSPFTSCNFEHKSVARHRLPYILFSNCGVWGSWDHMVFFFIMFYTRTYTPSHSLPLCPFFRCCGTLTNWTRPVPSWRTCSCSHTTSPGWHYESKRVPSRTVHFPWAPKPPRLRWP